jgi:ParB family chromosome partitioning protein
MKKTKINANSNEINLINVVNIPVSEINPPNVAMRASISPQSIETLAASIAEVGLISPIVIMKSKNKYEIVAGCRRFTAMKQLNFDFIPCIILQSNAEMYFKTMSAENYERQEINIFDEVQFILRLHDELSLNQGQIAKYIGKSVSYVNERLAILEYPECIKQALIDEKITFSVAREFNKITEAQVCETYLHYAIENGCTPAIARKWRQQWENQQAHPTMTPIDDMVDSYEITQQLIKVTQECASCRATFESHELLPLYVCKSCYSAISS